jgi:hypothetical protein
MAQSVDARSKVLNKIAIQRRVIPPSLRVKELEPLTVRVEPNKNEFTTTRHAWILGK